MHVNGLKFIILSTVAIINRHVILSIPPINLLSLWFASETYQSSTTAEIASKYIVSQIKATS